jgi:hypothetical protein
MDRRGADVALEYGAGAVGAQLVLAPGGALAQAAVSGLAADVGADEGGGAPGRFVRAVARAAAD